jgi:hypothetical protein
MNQSGISFEQQGAWEKAIVTVLAHTVHTAWTMLAEHERIITAAGGDTGHHGIRPGSPPYTILIAYTMLCYGTTPFPVLIGNAFSLAMHVT